MKRGRPKKNDNWCRNALHSVYATIAGRNLKSTPKKVIVDQMNEQRPLPMGRQEFDDWSGRIIAGALLPGGKEDFTTFEESQKFALSNMLLHLGPTESHKSDAFFIHSLRKSAINQVADAVRRELHEAAKKRTEAKEAMKEKEMDETEQGSI